MSGSDNTDDDFKVRLETFISKLSSDEFKLVVAEAFPVVRKLFGGDKEDPFCELPAFVESYMAVFKLNWKDHDPLLLATSSLWMKGYVEHYRSVVHECFDKRSKSLQAFATPEDLHHAHELGMSQSLDKFKQHTILPNPNAIPERDDDDLMREESLKSKLEQEFAWISAVNADRYARYVDCHFRKEFDEGKKKLLTEYTFETSDHSSFVLYSVSGMRDLIEEVISLRATSFRDSFEEGSGSSSLLQEVESELRAKLAQVGADLIKKNEETLQNFADYQDGQCLRVYEEQMKTILDAKSLIQMEEVQEEHLKLKAEVVQGWSKELREADKGAGDADISAGVAKLEQDIESTFVELWDGKRREVEDKCRRAWAPMVKQVSMSVLEKYGIAVDDNSISTASLPAQAAGEKFIHERIETLKIGQSQKRFKSERVEVETTDEVEVGSQSTGMELVPVASTSDPASNNCNEICEIFSSSCSRSSSSTPTVPSLGVLEISDKAFNEDDNADATGGGAAAAVPVPIVPSLTSDVDEIASGNTVLIPAIAPPPNVGIVIGNSEKPGDHQLPPRRPTPSSSPVVANDAHNIITSTAVEPGRLSMSKTVSTAVEAINVLDNIPDLRWTLVASPTTSPSPMNYDSITSTKKLEQDKSRRCKEIPDSTRSGNIKKKLEVVGNRRKLLSTTSNKKPPTTAPTSLLIPLESPSPAVSQKWQLVPIPNSDHHKLPPLPPLPTRIGKGKRRPSESLTHFHEAVQSFGITLTEAGLRAGVSINSVPHMLVEITGGSTENSIIPLKISLTLEDELVIGNEAKSLELEPSKCQFTHDISALFREDHTRRSETPIKASIAGKPVTFQLELLLGVILYKVAEIMESVLCSKFKRTVVDIHKLIISAPPDLLTFQTQQILDAAFVACFNSQYVAVLCNATPVTFDFARRQNSNITGTTAQIPAANVLRINQYSHFIEFDLLRYSVGPVGLKSRITVSPVENYRSGDVFGGFINQIGKCKRADETQELISRHVKTTSDKFGQPGFFVVHSAEDKDMARVINDAIRGIPHLPSSRLFQTDEWAALRGVTSLGNYGYWWSSKSHAVREVDLNQDRYIQYRLSKGGFEDQNLSQEEVEECRRMLLKFVGKSSGGGGDEEQHLRGGGGGPVPKKTRGSANYCTESEGQEAGRVTGKGRSRRQQK